MWGNESGEKNREGQNNMRRRQEEMILEVRLNKS